MGLDSVEFVMALEERFELAIADAEAEVLVTPRKVVDYLTERLSASSEGPCHEQRAFYRLRTAGMHVLRRPRSDFRPDSSWNDLLPTDSTDRQRAWESITALTGFESPGKLWFGKVRGQGATLGGSARRVAYKEPRSLQRPGEGWSRPQLEGIVRGLMAEELGIIEFEWDRTFRELGVN
jgi:hypothetical protein